MNKRDYTMLRVLQLVACLVLIPVSWYMFAAWDKSPAVLAVPLTVCTILTFIHCAIAIYGSYMHELDTRG